MSILISAFFCGGCGKGGAPEPAPGAVVRPAETNRALDAAYQRALRGRIDERSRLAAARNRALERMRAIEEKARGALPEGADAGQVAAACRKDPAWAGLEAECRAGDEALERQAGEIRGLIRDRIRREGRRREELRREGLRREGPRGAGAGGAGAAKAAGKDGKKEKGDARAR